MVKKQHDKIRENTASITELELDFKSLANILLKVSKGMHYELALKVNLLNGILFIFFPTADILESVYSMINKNRRIEDDMHQMESGTNEKSTTEIPPSAPHADPHPQPRIWQH